MKRTIGKEYETYDEYINFQKKKTTDPIRRKKWLGIEWNMKIKIFQKKFSEYIKKGFLKEGMKCICLGARTGQEVVALNNLKMDAIGIDIVEQEPNVIKGDIHDVPFEDNTFDFAFTNVFDHSIYPNKFISEIERVLKPNGYCLLHLEVDKKSDIYAENKVPTTESVIELFKKSKVLELHKIKMLSMNREVFLQKT